MPDLEALRSMFRGEGDSDSDSVPDLEDFRVVDIAGMSVQGQEDAIKEAALDLGWPVETEVKFDGCYKLVVSDANGQISVDLGFKQKSSDDDKDVVVIVKPYPLAAK